MEQIDLSFLVLTHNRPDKFKLCIDSILKIIKNFPDKKFEIIINNDSCDIEELDIIIPNCEIKYYYYNWELYKLYEFIYTSSSGQYCYFLEDDDQLHNQFNFIIEKLGTFDLLIGLYLPDKKISGTVLLRNFKYLIQSKFYNHPEFNYFQLSQIIFKRKLYNFPQNNDVLNDEVILQEIFQNNNTIEYSTKYLFKQYIYEDNFSLELLKEQYAASSKDTDILNI